MGVEFFVQNEGQSDLAHFSRNWNIRNIMRAILNLNRQLRNGVTSYYFRMEKNGKNVIVYDDAIRINQEILTEFVEDFFEDDSANKLFRALMETQYEDYLDTTICVYISDNMGDNMIQFVSEHIDVNVYEPFKIENEMNDLRNYYSTHKTRLLWYLPCGPYAGHHALMTVDEAECTEIDVSKIVDLTDDEAECTEIDVSKIVD